jgi:hypothetical protein
LIIPKSKNYYYIFLHFCEFQHVIISISSYLSNNVTGKINHSEYLKTEKETRLSFLHRNHQRKKATSFSALMASEKSSNNSVSPVSGSHKKEEETPATNKHKLTCRNGNKLNSFIFPRRGESALNLTYDNSSEGNSNRHMVFHKRSHREGSNAIVRMGESKMNRNKRIMSKPNSFTQIENLDINSKRSKNSLVSDDDSSQQSNHLVPKLSKSDFASYLNGGNK